jgi:signal transduction histidine kinase
MRASGKQLHKDLEGRLLDRVHDEKESTAESAKEFREQALRLISSSLEEALSQQPLDISQIFECARPSLGESVPIQLYRSLRLLVFREILGSDISAAILKVAGHSVGNKLGIQNTKDLVELFQNFGIGKITEINENNGKTTITLVECATCSGIPNIGQAVCHFETGLIRSAVERTYGTTATVKETRCWGLGHHICQWEAEPQVDTPEGEGTVNPLEILMTLAGKAAASVDNAIALRQKNRELRELCNRLKESERLRKDLTDMVIHDMRVPLTVILGSIETLTDTIDVKTPQQEQLLQIALSSGQDLLGMINDLLEVSKLEEGQVCLKKTQISIHNLIDEAITQVKVLATRKKISLNVEVSPGTPTIPVDKERIVRVLVNLLSNAVRHTPIGGKIVVSASYDPITRVVKTNVTDDGEGIPREYLDKIFEKFVQVESYKSKQRFSTGLGLTFCKLVVEAHGGHIWAESEPGHGSTFTFVLPIE